MTRIIIRYPHRLIFKTVGVADSSHLYAFFYQFIYAARYQHLFRHRYAPTGECRIQNRHTPVDVIVMPGGAVAPRLRGGGGSNIIRNLYRRLDWRFHHHQTGRRHRIQRQDHLSPQSLPEECLRPTRSAGLEPSHA